MNCKIIGSKIDTFLGDTFFFLISKTFYLWSKFGVFENTYWKAGVPRILLVFQHPTLRTPAFGVPGVSSTAYKKTFRHYWNSFQITNNRDV